MLRYLREDQSSTYKSTPPVGPPQMPRLFCVLLFFLSFSDIIVNVVNFTNRDVVRSNIAKIFVTLYDVFDEYKKSDSYYQAKIDKLTSGMF